MSSVAPLTACVHRMENLTPCDICHKEFLEARPKKPETLEEYKNKMRDMFLLLIECRDAIPAISLASAKIRGIDLKLADRIDDCLKPWELPPGTEDGI